MELEYKGKSYLFTINPETYDIKISRRMHTTYTKGGAFIDCFGEGIKEITITGTTGFKSTTGDPEHGYKKFIELKNFIEEDFKKTQDGEPINDFVNFYNHTDGEAYVTMVDHLKIYRNVSQPQLYKYDILLHAIRRVGDPAPTTEVQMIGNPLGTPTTGTETVKDRDLVEKDEPTRFTKANKDSGKSSNILDLANATLPMAKYVLDALKS